MKIYILDPIPEVNEYVEFVLSSHFGAEIRSFTEPKSCELALLKETMVQFFIVNRRFYNQKMEAFLKKIESGNPELALVLIATDESFTGSVSYTDRQIFSLHQPFSSEELISFIEGILEKDNQADFARSYHPVPLETLYRLQTVSMPRYVKLGLQKFIKIFRESAPFDEYEYLRLRSKGITHLYIEKSHYRKFVEEYRSAIFFQINWEKITPDDSFRDLSLDLEIVHRSSKIFGWSPDIVAMANDTISKTMSILKQVPDLKKMMGGLRSRKASLLAGHSVMLCYLTLEIAKKMGWISESTTQKIVFSCILHDLALDEDLFTTELTALNHGTLMELVGALTESEKLILEHPRLMAETLRTWGNRPTDVDEIVLQHHESPDGKGFPRKLPALKIFSLAALLILAEDVISHSYINPQQDPVEYLQERAEFYAHGEFKKIHQFAIEVLRPVKKTA